jgi:hypothetical protein
LVSLAAGVWRLVKSELAVTSVIRLAKISDAVSAYLAQVPGCEE